MPEKAIEVVSVGVDYLTSTFSGRKASREAATKAFDLLETEMGRGNFRKPWGMAGYHGWASGPVQVGHNHESLLVRLSSSAAFENWRWFGERADNISRIDYQVTTRTDDTPTRRLAQHWRQARRHKAKQKTNASVGAYFGDDSTPTVYLGRRVSNRFGRIYDKHRESGEEQWHGCVRYEVEYKNEAGLMMTRSLLRSQSEAQTIAADCVQFFQDRGVHLRGFLQGVGNYSCIRNPDDVLRRIKWIHTQVKPSIALLISMGHGPEVIKALGLQVDKNGELSLCGPLEQNEKKVRAA